MNEGPPDNIRIEYVKSSAFRVIRADGAIGGISPRLELFITFYNERFPIPKVLVFETTPEGAPGDEVMSERESKAGVIREAEVAISMDLPTAKSFVSWMNAKVAELEKTRTKVLTERGQSSPEKERVEE